MNISNLGLDTLLDYFFHFLSFFSGWLNWGIGITVALTLLGIFLNIPGGIGGDGDDE